MSQLIFDIETIGEDFDALDETTQEVLTKWIKKEAFDETEYKTLLDDLKKGLGFSPLTGEVVAIGVLDSEKNKGVVYYSCRKAAEQEDTSSAGSGEIHYQSRNDGEKESEEDGIRFRPMTEKEMLENFWNGARNYQEFVSFNGRGFDVPFLMVRSAIHGIRPSKDLMSNRYLSSQKFGALHVDLQDQLTFYGAVRRRGSLHTWSRAFGIESPKAQGVTGDDVGALFKEGKFLEIARYNVGDLKATKELYEYWNKYLRF